MNTESLSSRHIQDALKKILEHSNSIQASSSGLVEAMHALSDLSQHAGGKGKGSATPSRYLLVQEGAKLDMQVSDVLCKYHLALREFA